MTVIQEKFFKLLRYSIGSSKTAPLLSFEDLKAIYNVAEKQSLVAIVSEGAKTAPVTRLANDADFHKSGEGVYIRKKDADEYEDFIMTWVGKGISTDQRNAKLDKDITIVFDQFRKDGLGACLLKGQGNTLMYPNPRARTSGDIDAWVRPVESRRKSEDIDKDIRKVISFVRGEESYSTCDLSPHRWSEI